LKHVAEVFEGFRVLEIFRRRRFRVSERFSVSNFGERERFWERGFFG